MIVFDASTLVSAALKADGIPERALLKADRDDRLAVSADTMAEIALVLSRPKFSKTVSQKRRDEILDILQREAGWFVPTVQVTDCRDPKDDKYLELALAANAEIIVSSDDDLLVLHPWRSVSILRPAEYLAR